ncbi:Protein CHAPERONE-LIKE PROTEIN OF POR1-chloroplastic [Striga hermonthica]|uniref:Protein CHAPERONE-LIKE PROTEIN OF POR1-chloroplastic n=1 Tax=Striga hermonthica TaxID=68872 RepID=A0A9N7RN83_STRHE|nr:Protein CHAPERONE-LIKE PROTEIN OF POR1-chloroplastic [Striga hermonthica]
MTAALLCNSTISSSFHGRRLSIRGNSGKPKPCSFSHRSPRCAVDTPYEGGISKFPRIRVWNPYKRLGVSSDSSEEEIWSARNFLLTQYAGHEASAESIEAAFERLLMNSFWNRKKTKINLKTKLKKKVEESPPWIKNLVSFVELPIPPPAIILRRAFLFGLMAGWSLMNSAEAGPAFQVALSLAACIYFLNDKSKSFPRAAIIGFGALVVGWICGSILVPFIPTFLLLPTWSLELLTSLVAYVFMFLACTFLK